MQRPGWHHSRRQKPCSSLSGLGHATHGNLTAALASVRQARAVALTSPVGCGRHAQCVRSPHCSGLQEYREHEASREHVELAYERIVNESFKARQRKGYRPGRGKRGEREAYELPPTILERFTGMLDKGVTAADAAKDMVVYIALALWAGFAYPLNAAPTMLLFVYAVFRTTKKRTRRKPDGPYFGGSAVFGAVLANLVFMFLAFSTAGVIANALPWWRIDLTTPQVAIFFSSVLTGPLNIWFR